MTEFRDMFRGEMLYYNIFLYSLLPLMALFLILDPILVIVILIGYSALFGLFMTSRELKKRKSKEGQEHFDVRIFRSKGYTEEMILSFANIYEIKKEPMEGLNIINEPEYQMAQMIVIKEYEEEEKQLEEFNSVFQIKTKRLIPIIPNKDLGKSALLSAENPKKIKKGESKSNLKSETKDPIPEIPFVKKTKLTPNKREKNPEENPNGK